MISWITKFAEVQPPRALPQYQQFLNAQKQFIVKQQRRYLAAQGHESSGVKMLRFILQFVDIDYLDKQANNYERYLYHLRYIRRDIENIFDRSSRGTSYRKLFFTSEPYLTEEYLFPLEDVNSIVTLPLDANDWSTWKHVRTLRLWAQDSNEFTIKLINDKFDFTSYPPTYAIELLDVVALVFKYYVWYKTQRLLEPAQELASFAPEQLFIHKYVICDLTWDMANTWLLNNVNSIFDVPNKEDMVNYEHQNLQMESQYGYIANGSRKGFEYLWYLTHEAQRNMRPEVLLNSKTLYGGSIQDRIDLTNSHLIISPLKRYDWVRWLRDRDMIYFFINTWICRKDLPTAKTIFRNVNRDLNRFIIDRPWNIVHNILVRDNIEKDLYALREKIDSALY